MSKFGVKPSSLPDLFGLVGDVADNIPGKTFFFFLPSSHDCLFCCFSCARALCYLELLPGVDVPVVALVVFALFSFSVGIDFFLFVSTFCFLKDLSRAYNRSTASLSPFPRIHLSLRVRRSNACQSVLRCDLLPGTLIPSSAYVPACHPSDSPRLPFDVCIVDVR